MSEATNVTDGVLSVTVPTAGYAAGEVIQLPDGRAGVVCGLQALVSGERAGIQVAGRVTVPKTASVVVLPGGRVFWDRSANTATPLQAAAGADFFMGVCPDGAAAADATLVVDLNVQPSYLFDFHRDGSDSVIVLTAGTPTIQMRGGEAYLAFSATAEAQKLDILSRLSVPVGIPAIFECKFQVATVADADVADLSIGLANGTHASDADAITESAIFHQDSGADLNLDAESDDGTTEVAATDTTVDIVAGTDVEVWIDARDKSNCKYYVNGVEVLAATANLGNIAAATGPLKALVHWEKSANDSPGEVRVSHLAIRTTDLAS
jgi:predicted RecA/RadA family phage recombinase